MTELKEFDQELEVNRFFFETRNTGPIRRQVRSTRFRKDRCRRQVEQAGHGSDRKTSTSPAACRSLSC